jgi:hypothetical protein
MGRSTVSELLPAIGAEVMVRFEQISVICVVNDAKSSYGKERILVQPVSGCGVQWVELGRVSAIPRETSVSDICVRSGFVAENVEDIRFHVQHCKACSPEFLTGRTGSTSEW